MDIALFETDSKSLFNVVATTNVPFNEIDDIVFQRENLLFNILDFVYVLR